MEMLISRDWLRAKIASDPDLDSDAGAPIGILQSIGMFLSPELVEEEDSSNVIQLKHAFGVLVKQLRKRDKLSLEQLAGKARVDLEDIKQIEHDPHFRPRPRVIHQLASVFNVPVRSLMKLSGATIVHDEAFEGEALQFAAKSEDMSKLTRAEQRLLNDYVKYLSQLEA
tara:strand:+ start:419 stop:925 length:507 start_codon:yes stop_codon:yes gene_type:complete